MVDGEIVNFEEFRHEVIKKLAATLDVPPEILDIQFCSEPTLSKLHGDRMMDEIQQMADFREQCFTHMYEDWIKHEKDE